MARLDECEDRVSKALEDLAALGASNEALLEVGHEGSCGEHGWDLQQRDRRSSKKMKLIH